VTDEKTAETGAEAADTDIPTGDKAADAGEKTAEGRELTAAGAVDDAGEETAEGRELTGAGAADAEDDATLDFADTASVTARSTSFTQLSFAISAKELRIFEIVTREHPDTPTPTKSFQAEENPRAHVVGQESATLATNSGDIR
jgi:hypothetical protein